MTVKPSECQECRSVQDVVEHLYEKYHDQGHPVPETITGAVVILATLIASCTGADAMLVMAQEHLKTLTDDMRDAGVWNQGSFPLLSHYELAEGYSRCVPHMSQALKEQKLDHD